jgi:hypothetical protein
VRLGFNAMRARAIALLVLISVSVSKAQTSEWRISSFGDIRPIFVLHTPNKKNHTKDKYLFVHLVGSELVRVSPYRNHKGSEIYFPPSKSQAKRLQGKEISHFTYYDLEANLKIKLHFNRKK